MDCQSAVSNKSQCDYSLQWEFDPEADEVSFTLETRLPSAGGDWWSGVGFSPTGSMHDVDMVVLRARAATNGSGSSQISIHDTHVEAFGHMVEDEKKSPGPRLHSSSHTAGVLRAKFSRKRVTGDEFADYSLGDGHCFKWVFPVAGGRVEAGDASSGVNFTNPAIPAEVLATEICVGKCGGERFIIMEQAGKKWKKSRMEDRVRVESE